MENARLAQVADGYGTPVYVYDLGQVRRRFAELSQALPEGSRVLYSLKANPLPPLVSALRAQGAGAEVSSPGELGVALAAGVDPREVLYTGPGKTEHEITGAVHRGVDGFSAESPVDLDRLGRVAARTGRTLRILLRLHPAARPASGLSMADGRQFGFAPDEAARAWRAAAGGLRIEGCHVYLGSQIGSVDRLLAGFRFAKEVIDEVCTAVGSSPEVIDLGGGFPWPYAERGAGCDFAGLREGLTALLGPGPGPDSVSDRGPGGGPQVWFETGRRVTASAGWLLTTVMDVKHRPGGGTSIVVDAGINVLGGMAGLGRVMRPSATFDNLSRPAAQDGPDGPGELVTADVVGPLCTPLDRVAVRAELAVPQVGDVLGIPNVGAYGPTASLTAFLSRPAPLELVYDGEDFVGSWRLATGHSFVEE